MCESNDNGDARDGYAERRSVLRGRYEVSEGTIRGTDEDGRSQWEAVRGERGSLVDGKRGRLGWGVGIMVLVIDSLPSPRQQTKRTTPPIRDDSSLTPPPLRFDWKRL